MQPIIRTMQRDKVSNTELHSKVSKAHSQPGAAPSLASVPAPAADAAAAARADPLEPDAAAEYLQAPAASAALLLGLPLPPLLLMLPEPLCCAAAASAAAYAAADTNQRAPNRERARTLLTSPVHLPLPSTLSIPTLSPFSPCPLRRLALPCSYVSRLPTW